MTRLVRQFSVDERASIAHALLHLTANKIADDDYPGHIGWYCGNKTKFVRRHKKAIDLMRRLLKANAEAVARKPPQDGGSEGRP